MRARARVPQGRSVDMACVRMASFPAPDKRGPHRGLVARCRPAIKALATRMEHGSDQRPQQVSAAASPPGCSFAAGQDPTLGRQPETGHGGPARREPRLGANPGWQ